VIIRRHWPSARTTAAGWVVAQSDPTTTLAGLVTATLICLPFGITIVGLLQQIVQTAGGYPYLTVNAYNPWALVTMDGAGLASSGTWIRDAPNPENAADPFFTVLGIPAVLVGTTFIGAAIVALMVVLWRRHDDRRALLVALADGDRILRPAHARPRAPFYLFFALTLLASAPLAAAHAVPRSPTSRTSTRSRHCPSMTAPPGAHARRAREPGRQLGEGLLHCGRHRGLARPCRALVVAPRPAGAGRRTGCRPREAAGEAGEAPDAATHDGRRRCG
jgi:hypothetical protein